MSNLHTILFLTQTQICKMGSKIHCSWTNSHRHTIIKQKPTMAQVKIDLAKNPLSFLSQLLALLVMYCCVPNHPQTMIIYFVPKSAIWVRQKLTWGLKVCFQHDSLILVVLKKKNIYIFFNLSFFKKFYSIFTSPCVEG